MTYKKFVPIKELAKGHCLAVENAYRLVQDGEVLLNGQRYLSAINLFRLACEELAKAHIITQAICYSEDDEKQWDWFWFAFSDHREKLRILEYEFHWKGYKAKDEFHRRVNLLRQQREDTLYVGLDANANQFQKAGTLVGEEKDFAEVEYRYVLRLMKFFLSTGGLPTPDIMEDAYTNMAKKFWAKKKASVGD